jgi:hypothetical protein
MANTPATNKQIPDHSIMDHYNKQVYLGNQFVICNNFSSAGTSEVPLLLISNPAAVTTAAKALFINNKRVSSLTASDSVILRCYINPTVSSPGTPATPTNERPANTNISIATVATAPSVSANGTLIDTIVTGALTSNLSDLMTILDPGQVLLITIQASASSTATNTIINWYEI